MKIFENIIRNLKKQLKNFLLKFRKKNKEHLVKKSY